MVQKGNIGLIIVVLVILLLFTGILAGVRYDVRPLTQIWSWLGISSEPPAPEAPLIIRTTPPAQRSQPSIAPFRR